MMYVLNHPIFSIFIFILWSGFVISKNTDNSVHLEVLIDVHAYIPYSGKFLLVLIFV